MDVGRAAGKPRLEVAAASADTPSMRLCRLRSMGMGLTMGGERERSAETRAEALAQLLDAALETLDEGMAVLDADLQVASWNSAAEAITGYQHVDLLSRLLPTELYRVDSPEISISASMNAPQDAVAHRPILVNLRHRLGHTIPAMLLRTPLRDALGEQIGTFLCFHTVEEVDAPPRGGAAEGVRIERSQADVEDRLDEAYRHWATQAVPLGLLWIAVDQAAMLRKTHGYDACEAMMGIVEQSLLHGLRPTELLGKWGNNEFLVIAHERTLEMLAAHAQHLAGLARTGDFRWWGDRVSLTVSMGVALAVEGESLSSWMKRARKGMEASLYAGGNHVTNLAREYATDAGGDACSPS